MIPIFCTTILYNKVLYAKINFKIRCILLYLFMDKVEHLVYIVFIMHFQRGCYNLHFGCFVYIKFAHGKLQVVSNTYIYNGLCRYENKSPIITQYANNSSKIEII